MWGLSGLTSSWWACSQMVFMSFLFGGKANMIHGFAEESQDFVSLDMKGFGRTRVII